MSAKVITNAEFLKAMQAAGVIADAEQVISLTIRVDAETHVPIVWVELIGGPKLVEVVSLLAPSLTISDLVDPPPGALLPHVRVDAGHMACRACGQVHGGFMWRQGTEPGTPVIYRCVDCEADGTMPSFSAEPAEKDWTCPKCSSRQWVSASLTGPVGYGGKAIRQCVPCGHYDRNSSAS